MISVAIDLDNTILDTPNMIIDLYNRINDNKIEYNPNINLGWKFEPIIKTDEELAELFKLFDNPKFYKNTITFKNAIKIINELSIQNNVCIISKHMDSRKPLTEDWVNKTFLRVKLIFVDNFDDKGQALKEFGADIIIDDRVDALKSCNNIVPYRICFGNYKWNCNYNGLRATNWKELYKMIKNIKDTIEINKLINIKEREGIKGWEF